MTFPNRAPILSKQRLERKVEGETAGVVLRSVVYALVL